MGSMFDVFKETSTDEYSYLGKTVTITITPLSLREAVMLTEGKMEDKYKVILNSIKENHPDETLESVKGMPMAIANQLIERIFEFNDIDVPGAADDRAIPPDTQG